jgi:phosphodiesterase/alkaline phosphatase D-like protein
MKRDLRTIVLTISLIALALPYGVRAQSYDIPAYVIGGGADSSASASYRLSGTVGQYAARDTVGSASYIHAPGFWPAAQALTAPTGPDTFIVDISNGTGTDFTSFTAAVNHLNTNGISNPTVFLVRENTPTYPVYDEQITFGYIQGASATKTITFKSHPDNTNPVYLSHTAGGSADNWVIRFDPNSYARHIIIQGLTILPLGGTSGFARAIFFDGDFDNIQLLNNTISGFTTTSNSDSYALIFFSGGSGDTTNGLLISGNTFQEGSAGLDLDAYYSEPSTNAEITNNTFTGQSAGAIGIREMDGARITGNIMTSATSSRTDYNGIVVNRCDGSVEITGNKVNAQNSGKGIQVYYCTGADTAKGLVANNTIHVGGGGESSGLYIYSTHYQRIYHNTVNVTNGHSNSSAMWVGNGSNIEVVNNIFVNVGGGYAFRDPYDGTDVTVSDYNDHYTNGLRLARWANVDQADLAALKAANGMDVNSVSLNAAFVSDSDLQPRMPLLDNLGTSLAAVPTDINGVSRTGPDMGAYEYTPPGQSLSGSYSIASISDFNDALDDLYTLGVNGAVTFNIQSGTYNDYQFSMGPVMRATGNEIVTFRSQTGNAADVELTHAATADGDNYVVQFNGADYVTLQNLTLTATGTGTFTHAVRLTTNQPHPVDPYLSNIRIEGCTLNGADTTGTSNPNMTVVYSSGISSDNIVINSNSINDGSYGIYYHAINGDLATGTEITNNVLNSQGYWAAYIRYHQAPRITGNQFYTGTPSYSSYRGLHVADCPLGIEITGNRVFIETTYGYGISMDNCVGSQFFSGLIANNAISLVSGPGGASHGLYIVRSHYQNVYHNTIHVSTNSSTSRCIEQDGTGTSTNLNFQNNILSNPGGGYTYYTDDLNAVNVSDNNLLHTTGITLARWGSTNYNDLSALQTASSKDGNSIEADPRFTDEANSDFHLTVISPAIGAGLATGVATADDADIAGSFRPNPAGSAPDLGAYEHSLGTPEAGLLTGTYVIGAGGDYASFTEAVNALTSDGVNGPVTFQVLEGTYTEQISINSLISGVSAVNTITFEPHPNNTDTVHLEYTATVMNTAVIKIYNTPYITIQGLSVRAKGTDYARVIWIGSNADHTNILNNTLIGTITPASSIEQAIITVGGGSSLEPDSVIIRGNTCNNGSYGIYSTTGAGYYLTDLEIADNVFTGQTEMGVRVQRVDRPVVVGNEITVTDAPTTAYVGIYALDCINGIEVIGNFIAAHNYGIQFNNVTGNSTQLGLVVNNVISVDGTNSYGCIREDGCDYLDIYHNTGHINSASLPAVTLTGGSYINLQNNIFVNTGGSYALYADTPPTAAYYSNYNDFYATGNLAYWGTTVCADLTALQGANGQEANSVSADPKFRDQANLDYRLTGVSPAVGAGIPTGIAQVDTSDIRGFSRPRPEGSSPDLGAYEHTFDVPSVAGRFLVDMRGYIMRDIFNEQTDTVFVRGDFNSWDLSDPMSDFNVDSVYRAFVPVTPNSTVEYKYFINSAGAPSNGWEGSVGPTAPNYNRELTVAEADTYLVEVLFNNEPLPDVWPPAVPTGLTATAGAGQVDLSWDASPAPDIQFYTVFRNTTPDPGSAVWVEDVYTPTTSYLDGEPSNNVTYYYWLTATDNANNESAKTGWVSATPSKFVDPGVSFVHVGNSDIAWGDYDHDGDLDFVLAGYDRNSNSVALIYQSKGDGTFTPRGDYGLPAFWSTPSLAWGDYDGDGDLDLILATLSGEFMNPAALTEIYQYDSVQDEFSPVSLGVADIYSGTVAWGDYDNDGDLDVLITGRAAGFAPQAKIFRNDGGTTFVDIFDTVLFDRGVGEGAAAWGDYDNDGDLDILISGTDAQSTAVTHVIRNDGGSFTDINAGLIGVSESSAAWGDYDNDGDLDIVLTGMDDAGGGATSRVYRNDNGSFVDINASLTGLSVGSVEWGDYDNDGSLDILISGEIDWETFVTKVYHNDGGGFSEELLGLDSLAHGRATWGDYDNDGRLDILVSGQDRAMNDRTKLYRNLSATANSSPSAPAGLTASPVGGDAVDLLWNRASDNETPAAGLTYNLRVGTTTNGAEIVPYHADAATGYRHIPALGNVNHDTTWSLTGLAEGSYFWGVQAVDAGFMGSLFESEESFSIIDPPATPADFAATPGDGFVDLSWTANTEGDLAQYNVYRLGSDDFGNAPLLTTLNAADETYQDQDVVNGLTYYYWVTALDTFSFESGPAGSGPITPIGLNPNVASAWLDWEYIRAFDNWPVDPNPNPAAYQPTGPFTIETWIYPTQLPEQGDSMAVISRPNWDAPDLGEPLYDYQIHLINPDGLGAVVEFAVVDNAGNQSQVSAPITDFEWTHVAGTYDDQTNLRLYINGVDAGNTIFDGPLGNTGASFYVGVGAGVDENAWYFGFVDEIRFWSIARAPGEILANMNGALLGNEGELQGYWQLNETTTIAGVDNVTPDISGSNNHLRVGGAEIFPLTPFGPQVWPAVVMAGPNETIVGEELILHPIAGGGPGTSLSFISGPGGMVYDGANNVITWTPQPGQEGYQTFTMEISNTLDTYQDEFDIWVEQVPVNMALHDNNEVRFSVFNNGQLGHYLWDDTDVGFEYLGENGLYTGGLVIGYNNAQVSGGQNDEEFATRTDAYGIGSFLPGFEQAYQAEYDDQRAENPIGVHVVQRSHSKSTNPDHDYVIMDFTIENTSGAVLNNLRVGLTMDWDVGDYEQNLGGYDDTRDLSYLYESQGVPAPPAMAESATPSPSLAKPKSSSPVAAQVGYYYGTALLRGPVSGHYIGELQLWEDRELDSLMSQKDLAAAGPADLRSLLAAGPFNLQAGEKARVAFAVVGGASLADIQANTDAAQNVFNFSPVAVTDRVRDVTTTQAILEGTVNPNDLETTVTFLWGTDKDAYSNSKPVDPPITGAADIPVSVVADGLQAGTDYFYRVSASNADGSANGADLTFSTPAVDLFTKSADAPVATEVAESYGAAWGDVDGDGNLDLFVANSGTWDQPENNFLYHNQGDGSFVKLTAGPVVNDQAISSHGTWGDYDNDGNLDLFVSNWDSANVLYRNTGSGFEVIASPFEDDGGASNSAAWGDYDNDGDLDLFVTNSDMGEVNFLYNNSGPGGATPYRFTRITGEPWDSDASRSRTAAWVDYDNDGDLDLLVTNSVNNLNFLYQNNGPGQSFTFTKVTTGPLVTDATSSMGASWADYDNDGDLDLFLANAANQANVLYINEGNGSFSAAPAGIGEIVTDEDWSYNGNWADIDSDGDLDLFVTNSGNNALYINQGDGTFNKVGTGLLVTDGAYIYGNAWGDYNNDGRLDLFVASPDGQKQNLLYTANPNANHWINLKLVGTVSNRSGVGAKVRLKATGSPVWQMQDVSTSSGWMSQNSLNAEFGLGTATSIDSIVVEWPSGIVQTLTGVAGDQFLTITEQAVDVPTVVTRPATTITHTAAVLNGEVAPHFGSTTVRFEWGETTAYGSVEELNNPVEGGDVSVPVSVALSGLTANVTYHYRVTAENSAGSMEGNDQTFTTPADATTTTGTEVVTGDGTVDIPGTDIILAITFTSQTGEDTIEVAQMETTPSGTLPVDVNLVTNQYWQIDHSGEGEFSVDVTLDVSPDTVSAVDQTNPGNIALLRRDDETIADWTIVAYGSAATRTTVTFAGITGFSQFTVGSEVQGSAPTVATAAATDIAETSATLKGTVDPGGLTTTVKFEWGKTTAYDSVTYHDPREITGTGDVPVSVALTGLVEDTEYHYRVVANNREGQQTGADSTFTTLFVDRVAPEVATPTLVQTAPVDISNNLEIKAIVTDNVGVAAVDIIYGPGGAAILNSEVAMSATGAANEYSGTILADDVTIRGVVFYVEAEDAAENPDISDTMFVPVSFGADVLSTNIDQSAFPSGFPITSDPEQPQWRLISVPATLVQNSVTGTIGDELGMSTDSTWRLYEHESSIDPPWRQATNFNPGESYWLQQRVSSNVIFQTGAGRSVNTEMEYQLELQPGWNLVGNPFPFRVPVSLNQAEFYGPFTYDGSGWTNLQTQLSPWGGYIVWNHTASPLSVTLSAEPGGGVAKELLAKANTEPPAGWLMQFKAVGRTYHDVMNSIGRLDGASEHLDSYDKPEPPYIDGFVSLAMERPDWGANLPRFTSDVRSYEENDGVWDLELYVKGERGLINLTHELQGDLPPGNKIVLLDVLTHKVYDLLAGDEPVVFRQYREDYPYHLKVIAGSALYVDNTTEEILAQLPTEFALAQNYPNPFNPNTRLIYSLIRPAKVALRVYNLLGQEVITLVDDWHDLGHYEVMWDGRDRFGNQVASGIYFAAYMAEGKIRTRKMVMMK